MLKNKSCAFTYFHWRSIFLLVLVVSIVLLACEFTLRYFLLRATTEKRDHIVESWYMPVRFKPNYQGLFWGTSFVTNRHGFRGKKELDAISGHDEFRILSLGDSIAFGLGVDQSAHYTSVLETILNRRSNKKIRVINAGGQGYSPSNYYVYLKYTGLKFQPDMVLLEIELCNDISDEALLHWEIDTETPHQGPKAVRGGRYVRAWDGNLLATYSLGNYFFEKTYTYTDLLRRCLNLAYRIHPNPLFNGSLKNGICYYNLGFDRYLLSESRIESGWQKTLDSLFATHNLLYDHGIKFLLMLIPSRYVFETHKQPWNDCAVHLMERASKEISHRNISQLDLTQTIRNGGGKNLYFDFAHLTEEGNQVVGKALANRLSFQITSNTPSTTD